MFTKKIYKILFFAFILFLSFFVIFLFSCKTSAPEEMKATITETEKVEVIDEKEENIEEGKTKEDREEELEMDFSFNNAVKTPHWVSNIPNSNEILAGVPINVIINFNFDLYEGSNITISKDGNQYNTGDATIDENNLTLRISMDPDSPDGLYEVNYTACWPDGSCHDGSFEFAIDGSLSKSFTDLRGTKEVIINMENISFDKPEIIIDSGTIVTWKNLEDSGHYINTDPHAGHNYYPEQNSKLLSKEDSYSLIFTLPGVYPYHCSAHHSTMQGTILVK